MKKRNDQGFDVHKVPTHPNENKLKKIKESRKEDFKILEKMDIFELSNTNKF